MRKICDNHSGLLCGLPLSYADHGLHIGDVGYVNDHGMFEVQSNICFGLDHDLHQGKQLTGLVGLAKFSPNQAPLIPDAFSAGRAICHGIQGPQGDNLKHNNRNAPCKFKSCSTSGAILILPSGAVRQDLDKSAEKEFYQLAKKHALDWHQFIDCKSFYLITRFHKTCSWYLASFHDVRPTKQVLLERNDAGRYIWDSQCDYRESSNENCNVNQAVFISGFKIEVRGWDNYAQAVVERLLPHSGSVWSQLASWASSLFRILILLIASKSGLNHGARKEDADVHVSLVPALSQPCHPSDTISCYLLDKNPNALVAITHDSQWLSMLEMNELSHENVVDNGRFRAFLEENYTDDHMSDNVVYLRRKIDKSDSNNLRSSTYTPRSFCLPPASDDIQQFVITHIRAENIVACQMFGRMHVGFYVTIQFNDTKRMSKCKPASLHDNTIEWNDEIMLPMDPAVEVRFSIHASFEFEPMLGSGETLRTLKTSVSTLAHVGSTYMPWRENDTTSCSSLLITCEERRFDPFADWSHGNKDDCSCIEGTKETDNAHKRLLCYHQGGEIENLKEAVEYFRLALKHCPLNHECHAAARFNHATACFINCQVHGTVSGLDVVIASYRQALKLRLGYHPDRPRTLLHLAQALLYRQGRSQYEVSVADEIEEVTAEIKHICSESSYEYRAADLVIQTLKRYQVLTSGKLAELDELVSELDWSTRMPPDGHFDRPYRLMNFSIVLRKLFEITDHLDHIEKSISMMEEVLQLVLEGHFDKPWILASLGDARRLRFVQRGGVADLDRSISMIEDATKVLPDSHFDKPGVLASLGDALHVRFVQHGDVADLDMSIVTIEQAVEHTSDGHFDKPRMLTSLCDVLRARFVQCGDVADIHRSISMVEQALKLTPDDHFDRPRTLVSLYDSLRVHPVRPHSRWLPLIPLLVDHVLVDIDPDAVQDACMSSGLGSSGAGSRTNVIMDPIAIEGKLRFLGVKLLYEVCQVQTLSEQDLRVFSDSVIDYLFDLVEQTRFMRDETFNYSVIRLTVALNDQFMVAGLNNVASPPGGQGGMSEMQKRVPNVLISRLGSSETFEEKMIFMLNRASHSAEDVCMQFLVLKLLYILFTSEVASKCFHTNDLCVLVNVFLRKLVDLDESESLRHTYLHVLHPLLTQMQLRDIPYKRPQIVMALESLTQNARIRGVNPTTKRLAELCRSKEWCAQLQRSPLDKDTLHSQGTFHQDSSSHEFLASTTQAGLPSQPDNWIDFDWGWLYDNTTSPSSKSKQLNTSRSVENLKSPSAELAPSRSALMASGDKARRITLARAL